MAAKRKCLSLEDKVLIIKAVEQQKKKKGDIAKEFGIPQSSLSTILKDKERLLKVHEEGKKSTKCKRLRPAQYEDVEDALFTWFKDARAKNIPVSGAVLQQKARNYACLMGYDNFNVSEGWIGKFKNRHDIVCKKASGEAAAVSDVTVAEWLKEKLPLINSYKPCDVFNMDETGLFFKALPEHTLSLKGERCHGGKKSKDRVSVALCCNMDGTEKLKALVIGKSKNPRCMKGVKSLPVDYRNNAKSWMTGKLFQEWLLTLDKKMKTAKRNVLLLLDNVSSHVSSARLEAVTLLFFPPNTTSKMQPLDQGIIRSVKARYRRRLVQRVILNIDAKRETKIDLRMAIDMLHGSWQEVTSKTIQNCFSAAGIVRPTEEDEAVGPTEDEAFSRPNDSDEDDNELWQRLGLPEENAFNAFIDVDEDLEANEQLNDADIVQAVSKNTAECESSDEEIVETREAPVLAITAMDCLQTVRRFLQEKDNSPELFDNLNKIETYVLNVTLRKGEQRKITEFMST